MMFDPETAEGPKWFENELKKRMHYLTLDLLYIVYILTFPSPPSQAF